MPIPTTLMADLKIQSPGPSSPASGPSMQDPNGTWLLVCFPTHYLGYNAWFMHVEERTWNEILTQLTDRKNTSHPTSRSF
jgi:hypothetical protein